MAALEHRWYYPHGGYWYVGPSYRGPWTPVPFAKLPPAVVVVPVQYSKVPPGHLRHAHKAGSGKGRGRGKEAD